MLQLQDILKKNHASANSQFGEAAIVAGIFDAIGLTNRWCLEVGAGGGVQYSNTRHLIEQGWQAVLIECNARKFENLKKISPKSRCFCLSIQPTGAHSLDALLNLCNAPEVLDLMSIDIDGQEWHIWKHLEEHSARVIIIEYAPYIWWAKGRSHIDPNYIVPLGKKGQSGIGAMTSAMKEKDYEVIATTACNIICIKKELVELLEVYYDALD